MSYEVAPANSTHFPIIYGNEEETGMHGLRSRSGIEEHGQPRILSAHNAYVPYHGHDTFSSNGFRVYPDMGKVLEFCTPETTSVEELTTYIRATELYILETLANYGNDISSAQEPSRPTSLTFHRRVYDSEGHTHGVHDNFGCFYDIRSDNDARDLFIGFLVARNFLTGSGLITPQGAFYSQKTTKLVGEWGASTSATLYSVKEEEQKRYRPLLRIESRNNDVNLSDWAVRVRVGMTALTLALSQTPLAKRLGKYLPKTDSQTEWARHANKVIFTEDYGIVPDAHTYVALDCIRAIAEAVLSDLDAYVDFVPKELLVIAEQCLDTADDYTRVLSGKADVTTLSDRLDWAFKFSLVLRDMELCRERGVARSVTDARAQAVDLMYDAISLDFSDGELDEVSFGPGFKHRDSGGFVDSVSPEAAAHALANAPSSTRAHLRADLLQKHTIIEVDWDSVTVAMQEKRQKKVLLGPRQTKLPSKLRKRLEKAEPKK